MEDEPARHLPNGGLVIHREVVNFKQFIHSTPRVSLF